ncbi:MAG: dipeptidase [Candidatus Promineifilaceae bacterium]
MQNTLRNPLILDGHNDTVLRFYAEERLGLPRHSFFERNTIGHIDLPRAREGGLGGGFFAIYTPNEFKPPAKDSSGFPGMGDDDESEQAHYAIPLPPMIEQATSLKVTLAMFKRLLQWEAASNGQIRIVRTLAELRHCFANGIFAIIVHIEGAESIDADLDALYVMYEAGLRSLGPVWSRPTIFGDGVPFAFPADPDTGNGLTDAGKRLVKACNELGILIDMSHLNLKGFWDVAALSDAPLVCTHSGAHAMANSPRNLLDAQLDAIKESNGVVGIVYHTGFLRADGRAYLETSVTEIVRHAAYIAERIGIDHVALGSDFDGAMMPNDLIDVTGQPRILQAFREHGFSEADIVQVAHANWMRVLGATWR